MNHEMIRQLRIKNGYTQRYVANQLDVTQQWVYSVENGRSGGISIPLAIKLADFYNISLDDMAGRKCIGGNWVTPESHNVSEGGKS